MRTLIKIQKHAGQHQLIRGGERQIESTAAQTETHLTFSHLFKVAVLTLTLKVADRTLPPLTSPG